MIHKAKWAGLLLAASTITTTARTILVDIVPTGATGAASTAADFKVYDPNVSLSATPNIVATWAGMTTTVTDELANSYPITTTGAVNSQFNAGAASWNDNTPIMEGYIYDRDTTPPNANTVTISGMNQIPAGELITLTVFGLGDNLNQESDFFATYNGVTTPVQQTEYGSNRLTETGSTRFAQFTFTSDGTATDLTFTWRRKNNPSGSSNSAPAALNGFSITSAPPNFGDVTAADLTAPGATTWLVGAPNVQLTATGTFSIDGVVDVTALGSSVVTFSSSNPSAATVSESGLVTFVGPGTTTITATVTGDNSTSAMDTVDFTVEAPTSLVITAPATTLLAQGFTTNLTTTASGTTLTNVAVEGYTGFSYSSTDDFIAAVSSPSGVVSPVGPGVATITATLGSLNQTVDITVEEPTSIDATVSTSTLYVGAAGVTVQVTASSASFTNLPINGLSALSFASDDIFIATVNSITGAISPVAEGTANITATFGALSDPVAITVLPLPLKPTTLVHRYSFNSTAGPATAGAAITDSVGTAHGLVVGDGATFTGGALQLPGGLATSTAAYGDLPNGVISALPKAATFEVWVTYDVATNWQRVFDFGSNSGGEGNHGNQIASLNLSLFKSGNPNHPVSEFTHNRGTNGVQTIVTTSPYTVATQAHVVMTHDSEAGIRKIYLNGVLTGSQPLTFGISDLSGLNDVNNYLGKSQSGDPRLQGSFDEFRIYTGIMTESEAAANYSLGPDTLPGEGQTYSQWAAANAGNQASNLDFDNDGVANGVEYFMGAAAGFTANPGAVAGKITWPKNPDFVGTYTVQTSPDLSVWTDRASVVVGDTVEYTVTSDPNERFVRLKVTP